MEVYIKLGIAFMCSVAIFVVMMRIQKKKEKEAEEKFLFTLKCKGMNPNVEEKK